MGTLRKMKREQNPKKFTQQLNLELAESLIFNRGFDAGAKEQRESDIRCLVELLETLEELHGIGEKTADKIREMFLSRFGK
jgi:hypothetical protein